MLRHLRSSLITLLNSNPSSPEILSSSNTHSWVYSVTERHVDPPRGHRIEDETQILLVRRIFQPNDKGMITRVSITNKILLDVLRELTRDVIGVNLIPKEPTVSVINESLFSLYMYCFG